MDESLKILKKITSAHGLFSSGSKSLLDGIPPFKLQMSLDIPNFYVKVDVDTVDLCIQQIRSFFTMNDLIDTVKITIATLQMCTMTRCWW
jgi:hypothetical protein